jgi:heavy metal sensor kinase
VGRAKDADSLLEILERRFARHEGFDFQITQANGQRFFANPRLESRTLPLPSSVAFDPSYESVMVDRAGFRLVNVQAAGPDGPLTIQIARSLAAFDKEMAALLTTFILAVPLALLLAIGGGYFLARRALAPVQVMTETANVISADRLNERLPVGNSHDEIGGLAQTLNRMIERLERSFIEMQRFTADAAHELRTPLAVMRTEAEVALRSPRTTEDYCRVLENLLEETNRLSNLADQLLFLCRQDAGLQPGKQEPISMQALLREVLANMQLVAEERSVNLSMDGECHSEIIGDGIQLRRVMYNLIDNAIKYTPAGGKVTVRAAEANGCLSVTIKDTGIGIPANHLPRIFDRFYRVDPARTGENGAGLGLALCQSIVKGLGGRIAVASELGQGTSVTVELPRQ